MKIKMILSIQNKTRLAFALVFVLFIYTAYTRNPPSEDLRFKIKGNTAYVNGTTNSHSYGIFKDFLNENPNLDSLILQRMPGTIDSNTNLRIARMIRNRGLSTHLQRRSRIASGAVDLFLSGINRTMECGAMIGVHSWSYSGDVGPAELGWDPNQKQHEDFLEDMGIDTRFYVFTREAADHDDLHILSMDEIQKFGLLTGNGNCE